MTVVVDASVAVKWVIREPDSDAADALFDGDGLIAPALWLAEAANVLWRRARIGEITPDQASARMAELLQAPVTSLAMEPLLVPALAIATVIAHPIYDCIYLALAVRHDTYVVTADRRLVTAAATQSDLADRVRLLVT